MMKNCLQVDKKKNCLISSLVNYPFLISNQFIDFSDSYKFFQFF